MDKFREFGNKWAPLISAPIAVKIAQDKINQEKIDQNEKVK